MPNTYATPNQSSTLNLKIWQTLIKNNISNYIFDQEIKRVITTISFNFYGNDTTKRTQNEFNYFLYGDHKDYKLNEIELKI